MRRKYSENDIKMMIELYKEGLSQQQVADKIGCSKGYVEKVLRINNIEGRCKAYYSKQFDDMTENEIIKDYYENNMSIRNLAKKYDCSTAPIVSMFKRRKLSFRDPSSYKTYSINSHYFDEIDTEKKAYMLGFLYADGANCSHKGHYVVSLTLQARDEHILKEFLKEIGSDSPITDFIKKETGVVYKRIQICNKRIIEMLEKYGVVPRKSLITTYPYWLRDDLTRHFLRGLFDGDGSIQSQFGYINFSGSNSLMTSVKEILEEKFNAHVREYNQTGKHPCFKQLFCSKKQDMANILYWLYEDSNIYLNRKYEQYITFKTQNDKYIISCYDNGLAI